MRCLKSVVIALAAVTIFALLAATPDARAGSDDGELAAPAQAESRQQEALRTNSAATQHAIGGVALIKGGASVTRGSTASTLKVSDAIFLRDVLQTASDGTLGVTFNDATTFSLLPNSEITVDDFVYQERGQRNVATFEVIKGAVSFVASAVAKTGDMRIDTQTAAIGVRGTTGIIEIPSTAATGAPSGMSIKLYPDADGHVGRIEVFGRDGSQLGVLTAGATGFLVRTGAPGAPGSSAVPLQISQQELEVIALSCAKPSPRNKRVGGSIYSVRTCCGKIGSPRPVRDQARPQIG
ncbi:MAG TPA: FecR domain-containing protein [Xanthobacteraceae bacterium]